MKPNYLISLAARLEGKRLHTKARKAGFRVKVDANELYIIPESTGKPRRVNRKGIVALLEEYERSGIDRPGHYSDLTFDASYLLAILTHSGELT